ncbi:hypothetical protein [Actinomyces sp.]|uniref:hypothetical protein n=1 Tax=Actinomyces sp. TaxID=29317 RepID=UPI0026DCB80E|nr:hypothetical protein [Actinomyces sp.]MDO4899575.1 hypothetical protein [Actinomyces sp.]
MSIAVAVVSAVGRMGSTVCQTVEDADGLAFVARLHAAPPTLTALPNMCWTTCSGSPAGIGWPD